jgi:hypothetical protein
MDKQGRAGIGPALPTCCHHGYWLSGWGVWPYTAIKIQWIGGGNGCVRRASAVAICGRTLAAAPSAEGGTTASGLRPVDVGVRCLGSVVAVTGGVGKAGARKYKRWSFRWPAPGGNCRVPSVVAHQHLPLRHILGQRPDPAESNSQSQAVGSIGHLLDEQRR